MRYVSINSVPNGSTGAVMRQITDERRALGDECWMMWGRGRAASNEHECNYGSRPGLYLDVLQTRLDGRAGFHSKASTRRLLAKLDEVGPDVVHLHNVHGYHLNVEMLFGWLAAHEDVRVRWTLHDCWTFTGHCAHFDCVGCDRWRNGTCGDDCPQLSAYPKTFSRASCAWNYAHKREIFTRIPSERMTLAVPSHWIEGLLRESFLSAYPVEVRHNRVDATIFRPTPSDFRERFGIGSRCMILGVASPWTERKGLGDFVRLAHELDPTRYVIVLVGLNAKQIKSLPATVIGLERVGSPLELAKIYTAADVLINLTREDTFPTVNLEAEACGTPVITSDVGGCRETIARKDSSIVAVPLDAGDLMDALERVDLGIRHLSGGQS